MNYTVRLTDDAEWDLEEIDDYISENDSPEKAGIVLERIERAIASLGQSPARGVYLPEEQSLRIRGHREIFFKPYRIVYQVTAKLVVVKLIADGRRDLRDLFHRRLSNG